MGSDDIEIGNPYQSPAEPDRPEAATEAAAAPELISKKRLMLLGMLTVYVIRGLRRGYFESDQTSNLMMTLVEGLSFAALVVQWCYYDLSERHLPRWRYLAVLMVFCPGPLVMVPYYLICTRGWGRGSGAILLSLLFFALLIGVEALGCFAALMLSGSAPF